MKLFTIAPMYRYRPPQKGRYREHWQLSVEAIGSADPAVDAEVIQFYADAARPARGHAVRAAAQLDRRRRLPAGLRRAPQRLARRASPTLLDEEARQKRATSPLRVFDVKNAGLRAALADAPKIGESLCDECRRALRGGMRLPRRVRGRRTRSSRRSCVASTTTRARRGSSSAPTRTRSRRSAAAAATTG